MDMKDAVFLILFAVFIIWSIWGIRKVNKVQNDFNRIFEKIAELKNYAEITQREHRKQFLDFMIKIRSVSNDALLPKVIKDEEQFFDQVECNCDNLTQKIALIGINHPSIKHLYQEK